MPLMPPPLRYDWYRRLQPRLPQENVDRGYRAEVHDAAWFLARQWVMGEFQGEDASSPVEVRYHVAHQRILPYDGDPELDPQVTPAEAIIESEPGDWWTPGRRIRIGREIAADAGVALPALASEPGAALALANLPAPYHRFDGTGYDGALLYAERIALGIAGHASFQGVPADPADLWDSAELVYNATFTCAGTNLEAPRHAGGHVDWYTVEAATPLPEPTQAELGPEVKTYLDRMRYPGAPHPRWWQIEDADADITSFPPDRSHFATMLLLDLLVARSDDWFNFTIPARPGSVVRLRNVIVRDSFDDEYELRPPVPAPGHDPWSLFSVTGLHPDTLVVWPTVSSPQRGPSLDEVVLGIDEDANLLVAVERRLHGRDVPTPARAEDVSPQEQLGIVEGSARRRFRYRPNQGVVERWHPYQIQVGAGGTRRFVQAAFADLRGGVPAIMPLPETNLLLDPGGAAPHEIEPSTVPVNGIHLERRYLLARRTDGRPVLWMQRRRRPLLAPPVSGLRWDVLEDAL